MATGLNEIWGRNVAQHVAPKPLPGSRKTERNVCNSLPIGESCSCALRPRAKTGPEIAAEIEAVSSLLGALFEHQRSTRESRPIASPFIMRDPATIPTRAETTIRDLARDPVGTSLRQAIRMVGDRIYEAGGIDLLHFAYGKAGEHDPENAGRRSAALNTAWDGIGQEWFA